LLLAALMTLPLVLAACASSTPPPVAEPMPAVPSAAAAPAAVASSNPAAPGGAELVPVVREGNAVYFERGATSLDAAGERVLQNHAERLRDDPRRVVILVGHTDHLGSRSYNLAIAEQRTAVVMSRLRELGVPARQIRRRHYGNAAAPHCRSESCRARMRRVDLIYPRPATGSRPAAQPERSRGDGK